jgi:hypothetical protein
MLFFCPKVFLLFVFTLDCCQDSRFFVLRHVVVSHFYMLEVFLCLTAGVDEVFFMFFPIEKSVFN